MRRAMGHVVAVAGASGLLGAEVLKALEESFPVGELRAIAGGDAGSEPVEFREEEVELAPADAKTFDGVDVLFLAGSAKEAGELAKLAFPRGVRLIVDLSGRFADEADVPLILSSVNPAAMNSLPARALVAVPDPVTSIVATALAPLAAAVGIARVHASTYESASGMGRAGMDELGKQIKELFNYRSSESRIFPRALAFNSLPRVGAFSANGFTDAEHAFARHVARLLGGGTKVSATRAWVPAFSAHSVSLLVETKTPISPADARKLLDEHDSIEVLDDPQEDEFPVSGDTVGGDTVVVGRLRADESDPTRLLLWATGDNVRIGGALAAVRLAREVLGQKPS